MAVNTMDPALAGTPPQAFTNNETTKPVLMGATAAVETVGELSTVAVAAYPTGVALAGTGGASSGNRYIYKNITSATTFTVQTFWDYTDAGGISTNSVILLINAGSGRIMQVYIGTTEQLVIQNSALANSHITTLSGGFLSSTVYRFECSMTMGGSTTTATAHFASYTAAGTTPLAGTEFTDTGNWNAGTTAGVSQIRFGPMAATGTSDDDVRVGVTRYDPTTATFIGPFDVPDPTPGSTVSGAWTLVEDSSTGGVGGALSFSAFATDPTTDWYEVDDGQWLVKQDPDDPINYSYTVTEAGGGSVEETGSVPAAGSGGATIFLKRYSTVGGWEE